ncbi:hypothetical protein [Palleronia sp.]|uniref:hypothetical protein n=1 Tax=Palleronia sp. TaxID=1940284 RepID=UPI0035C86341
MPDLCLDNLDRFIAAAIAVARVVDTAIVSNVIPYLPAIHRVFAKDVRNLTVAERLFEAKTLPQFDGLIELMEDAIVKGTTEETVFDNSPEHVSEGGWTHRRHNDTAEELGRALIVILELRDTLLAVQDLRATQRIVERMHAES